MKVKDAFEIKEKHLTGHESGLVVVLDTLAARNPKVLEGRTATIRTPAGEVLSLPIDEAKEHGPVNSLFFKGLVREDVPVDSDISIDQELTREAEKSAPAPIF
jgi:hypothetical protein